MNLCTTLVWLLFLTASPNPQQPSTAQQQNPPAGAAAATPTIDSAKEADIRLLLKLTGAESLALQGMNSMATDMKPLMKNAFPPGEYREKLVDLFFVKFQSKLGPAHIIDLAVPIYDNHFSAEEIKGLIQFYQTPLGQKAISTLPKLVSELRDAGRQWGEKMGREAMQEVLAEHPDLVNAMKEAEKAKQ